MYQKIFNYIDVEIWNIKLETLPKYKAWSIQVLKIIILSIRYFLRDKCSDRASALSYYTLLTIVPVLAMAFGIAQGFGLENVLAEQIRETFKGQQEIMNRLLEIVQNVLGGTKEEVVAGIGIVVLLWSVLRILSSVEETMNVIWQAKNSRTLMRKVVDYSALLIIVPILVAISSGLTVFITSIVTEYTSEGSFLGSVAPVINFPLKVLPYAIIWLVLTFLYMVMPNTKVDFKAALIGGIIAGTAYQLTQWAYITFQIGASNMNAIYGSFAALPLFFVWLQTSWIIVLFGTELSYSIQHIGDYEQRGEVEKVSIHYKKVLTLTVLHMIIKRFESGKEPLTAKELSVATEIPLKMIEKIIGNLQASKIISHTQLEDKRLAYQPARDISSLTIHQVFELMDKRGVNELDINETPAFKTIKEALEELSFHEMKSDANLLLKDLETKS